MLVDVIVHNNEVLLCLREPLADMSNLLSCVVTESVEAMKSITVRRRQAHAAKDGVYDPIGVGAEEEGPDERLQGAGTLVVEEA